MTLAMKRGGGVGVRGEKSYGMQEKRWDLGCVGGGKDIKKIFSLNRVFLNNPTIILCFSAHHWASDYHALRSGPHQHRQPDREKKQ